MGEEPRVLSTEPFLYHPKFPATIVDQILQRGRSGTTYDLAAKHWMISAELGLKIKKVFMAGLATKEQYNQA